MSTVKSKKLQVGTDATSSNNFTIYQPSTPDGTLRIGVGNADSPTEVGRFTSAGYKPATAPAFRAVLGANQSISTSTHTKLSLSSEDFDTTNSFDSSTNYRFQPSIEGYYMISGNVTLANNVNNIGGYTQLRKNGTSFAIASGSSNASIYSGFAVASMVYLNGSTDYIELWIYQNSGSSKNALVGVFGTDGTYLTGHLVQQA